MFKFDQAPATTKTHDDLMETPSCCDAAIIERIRHDHTQRRLSAGHVVPDGMSASVALKFRFWRIERYVCEDAYIANVSSDAVLNEIEVRAWRAYCALMQMPAETFGDILAKARATGVMYDLEECSGEQIEVGQLSPILQDIEHLARSAQVS